MRLFCTDDYAPYEEALPVGRHYIGKDQTQRSESNNSRQRHWLARFRRRTGVVSRSVEMVDCTRRRQSRPMERRHKGTAGGVRSGHW